MRTPVRVVFGLVSLVDRLAQTDIQSAISNLITVFFYQFISVVVLRSVNECEVCLEANYLGSTEFGRLTRHVTNICVNRFNVNYKKKGKRKRVPDKSNVVAKPNGKSLRSGIGSETTVVTLNYTIRYQNYFARQSTN